MIKRPLNRIPAKPVPKKRLRATAPRASSKPGPDENELEEPNVKLSRAFVVVLLLHVVAVSGIFAFSALKDHQQAGRANAGKGRSDDGKGSLQVNTTTSRNELTAAVNSVHRVKAGETLATIAAAKGLTSHDLELANNLKPGAALAPGKELVVPDKAALRPVPLDVQKLVESPRAAALASKANNSPANDKGSDDGGRTYVVQRGDTPAVIAKRLKVSAAELLKLNNIADPKKLQVGQKLAVP